MLMHTNPQTEDTGYYYTTDHNFTTPWNFARDEPPPTHVIIHIGCASQLTDERKEHG